MLKPSSLLSGINLIPTSQVEIRHTLHVFSLVIPGCPQLSPVVNLGTGSFSPDAH